MNVILTLTTVGIDHGALFDLYSNADGYSVKNIWGLRKNKPDHESHKSNE